MRDMRGSYMRHDSFVWVKRDTIHSYMSTQHALDRARTHTHTYKNTHIHTHAHAHAQTHTHTLHTYT